MTREQLTRTSSAQKDSASQPASRVTADVTVQIVRNERGRFRIGDVDVELSIGVAEEDAAAFERCQGLFEDFCIVTESVRHGIPVHVRVTKQAGALVAEAEPA